MRANKRDAIRWQACREFRSAEWPDGVVIYDTASGDTHHLTPAALQILNLIHDSPSTLKALAEVLPSGATAEDSLSMIEAIVTDLTELGFIEPKSH